MDAAYVLIWLLEFSLRPLALCLAAVALIVVLRVKSPAAHHAIWSVTAGGMLLLALFAAALPALPVRVLPAPPAVRSTAFPATFAAAPAAPLEPVPAPIPWDRLAIGIYAAAVCAFAARLAYSYRLTQRLVRAARPLPQFAGDAVFESDAITVPLTLGWRRPKILLPADWATWPPQMLEAVMAHERAHIARADWAIALLAAVNRCVFWFHPLAWWLERRLALLAELACDDAALARVPSPAAYAEVLVEMAAQVRRGGARVTWEAMAMARHSEVRQRVERILDESRQILPGLTRARWMALLACALPLVYLAAAVRPARVLAQQPPQTKPPSSSQTVVDELAELLRRQDRALNQSQESVVQAQREAELLRQQKFELEAKRTLADEAAAEAAHAAQQSASQLQQQIEFTRLMEALKAQIVALSEQLTPNHPTLRRAEAELAALQLRATRSGDDLAAAGQETERRAAHTRELLEAEIERLNAQLQEKRKELELLGGPQAAAHLPALIVKRDPEYTQAALDARIEGRVDLDVTISEGRATNIKVVRSLGLGLDEKALECVKYWRWQPEMRDGKPVSHRISLAILFKLPVQK